MPKVLIHPGYTCEIRMELTPDSGLNRRMEIRTREQQQPFTTKDGSTIRSLLDLSNAPVANQSLAEATLPADSQTERHYRRRSF